MYKLETVNNSNFNFIDDFNITTEYKEELLDICTNKNIFKKLLLGKNIKFIKSGKDYIGFMWFSRIQHQSYKIHCIKVMPEFNTEEYYKELFKLFNSNSSILIGDNNNLKKELLIDRGFNVVKTIVEMKRPLSKEAVLDFVDADTSFRVFVDGEDEYKRCIIQNKVFNSLNRQAIDEEDIQYEKYQKHYISEGCIFICKGEIDIGYGQLIKKDSKIYIANFGILPIYRGKGYGRQLLTHLLKVAERLNYQYIYLRCDVENSDALRLYYAQDFQVIDSYCEYQKNEM